MGNRGPAINRAEGNPIPMTFHRVAPGLLLLALLCGCSAAPVDRGAAVDAWMELYEARDFFRLRDALVTVDPEDDAAPRVVFLRAAVQHSFNRPADSNATIEPLLEREDLPGELRKEVLFLRLNNLVRLYRYADAASAASEVLALGDQVLTAKETSDVENSLKMMQALSGVPPQELVARGATTLDYGSDGRIDVTIDGAAFRIPFDTGANLSLLMRSEAERLGLTIRPAGIEVGTSTDLKVHADLAVGERVEIGAMEYRHVVFLVFPDEMLTFPGGHVIEGLVGFPLIEAMGEVRFRRGGILEIPESIPERAMNNLALQQLEPLVRVGYEDDGLVCRLDTGADDTTLYEPFYRRYPALFEGMGEPGTVKSGGVGGIRATSAYTLPAIELEIGGAAVTLQDVEVYTTSITDEESNDLLCNIGRTALAGFEEYAINFRSMSFTVTSPTRR